MCVWCGGFDGRVETELCLVLRRRGRCPNLLAGKGLSLRRKNGTDLVDNEVRLLGLAVDLVMRAEEQGPIYDRRFHGYELVRQMQRDAQATKTRPLNHATIYRALRHLEETGALSAEWEDAASAEEE